jgi:aspartate carbamoyltransferase catalytic subunit
VVVKRDLVSIDDLSSGEIAALFRTVDEMAARPREWTHLAQGVILASLFYEPSTRTRLSFEAAMHRLGGSVISAADMRSSSAAKGETLADTVRVVGGAYADILALRHPAEGAARVAARYASIPVVNAGDGSHEHPTQTICDLYSLYAEKGRLEGLDVVLSGDLKYSRTVHSLAYALARLRANVVLIPHRGFEMPEYVIRRLRERYGNEPQRLEADDFRSIAGRADAVYFTSQRPHQLSLFTEANRVAIAKLDALYVTRPQQERFSEGEAAPPVRIDREALSGARFKDTFVMHPLPRVNEISYDLDQDPRSLYFKQAARGVPVRMALLAFLLGRLDLGAEAPAPEPTVESVRGRQGMACPNPTCITNLESHYLEPEYVVVSRTPLTASCAFCEVAVAPALVGCASTRVFHRHNSADVRRIKAEHLVLFASEEQARGSGFAAAARP